MTGDAAVTTVVTPGSPVLRTATLNFVFARVVLVTFVGELQRINTALICNVDLRVYANGTLLFKGPDVKWAAGCGENLDRKALNFQGVMTVPAGAQTITIELAGKDDHNDNTAIAGSMTGDLVYL